MAFAQKDVGRVLNEKIKSARPVASVADIHKTYVSVTYSKPEDYVSAPYDQDVKQGTMKVQTTCSALLLNNKGMLAIKRDCLPAIKTAADNSQIILFVNLAKLGNYNDVETDVQADDVGSGLYYLTENAAWNDFTVRNDMILFSIPVRSKALRDGLKKAFPKGEEISAEKAVAALQKMPAKKISKSFQTY